MRGRWRDSKHTSIPGNKQFYDNLPLKGVKEGVVNGNSHRLSQSTSLEGLSNQITFIGLVSSENYYRRPRIITSIA